VLVRRVDREHNIDEWIEWSLSALFKVLFRVEMHSISCCFQLGVEREEIGDPPVRVRCSASDLFEFLIVFSPNGKLNGDARGGLSTTGVKNVSGDGGSLGGRLRCSDG